MNRRQNYTIICEKSGFPHDTMRKVQAGPPSYAVVETIAEIKGTESGSLEPLYSSIDPDALDQLLQRSDQHGPPESVNIEFSYESYHVTISSESKPTTPQKNGLHSHE